MGDAKPDWDRNGKAKVRSKNFEFGRRRIDVHPIETSTLLLAATFERSPVVGLQKLRGRALFVDFVQQRRAHVQHVHVEVKVWDCWSTFVHNQVRLVSEEFLVGMV